MELRTVVFNSVLALIVVLPFVTLWLASPIVWTALRTGRLLGRGRIYDRTERPAMYYGGIIFWFVLLAVLILMSSLVLTHWGNEASAHPAISRPRLGDAQSRVYVVAKAIPPQITR